jgi:peptidoglycan/xylan/chitin deacetylase (PgdA/CDA1 family)
MELTRNYFHQRAPGLIDKLGCIVNPFLLKFKNENNRLLIFCFHGLFETTKQKELNHIDPQNNMTVDQFSEFIEYFLHHKYKFISPEDLLTGLQKNHRYAMITFDDGYYNNMLAVKILNKFNIPAVIFITTRNLMENNSFWWDIIYKFRLKQGASITAIQNEQRSLKNFKYQYIDEYILKNFGAESFKPWSDIDRPLNQSEIQALTGNPLISFGNHSHNHAILANYNKYEISQELLESNKILHNLTGKIPLTIAFPNGSYNNIVLEVTREAGYKVAFTIDRKTNFLPLDYQNLICLNRYMTNTTKVKHFGGFCRLDYDPDRFYSQFRYQLKKFPKKFKSFIHT